MSVSITAALIAAGVIGMAFSNTRSMAIAAVAALTFIYPRLVILILVLVGAYLYFRHFRK